MRGQTSLEFRTFIIEFLKYNFTPMLIFFSFYVLFCAIVILKVPVKTILQFAFYIVLVYVIYLLIYDISYVQYIIAYSEKFFYSFKLTTSLPLSTFKLSSHAPSKAFPTFQNVHFVILLNKIKNTYIFKFYYKYMEWNKRRLLFYAKIFILILILPTIKVKYGKDTKILNINWMKITDVKYVFKYQKKEGIKND